LKNIFDEIVEQAALRILIHRDFEFVEQQRGKGADKRTIVNVSLLR